jgi:hypothetical protein
MFIKLRRMTPLAMVVVASMPMWAFQASADETIDAFAREHLRASQSAAQAQTAGAAASEGTDAAPAQFTLPPELLFIHGVEDTTVAYLRLDGRYGYSVSNGDRFGEWQVVKIGSEFVDVSRKGKQQRLLLPNAIGAGPTSNAKAGPPGRM